MTTRFRHGLVVGKFSPLHRGHQLLIDTALQQCDQLTIISYALPEYPGCGTRMREQWLEALYPQANRLVVDQQSMAQLFPDGSLPLPHDDEHESVHRTFCGRLCRDLLGITVDAVFTSEDYGDGFARELTAFFRQREPQVAEVRHVQVDQPRLQRPVSGTLVRSDPHLHRNWLAPQVYASFVQRICLLGGESTGKSTLTAALAAHFNTAYVAEYGRELWEEKDGALLYGDMLTIGREQLRREGQALLSANRYLFCDTSPLTTMLYSRYMFDRCDPELESLAERRYDYVFLCMPDVAFVQDGTRQTDAFRMQQHQWYLDELERLGITYITVAGSVAERVAAVERILGVE